MINPVSVGDLVISIAGRDKDEIFLVVGSENGFSFIVDGKTRKVGKPKKKNNKHLKTLISESNKELAEKIRRGESVGNKTIHRTIKAEKEKLQED